jgi:hypothetical protein
VDKLHDKVAIGSAVHSLNDNATGGEERESETTRGRELCSILPSVIRACAFKMKRWGADRLRTLLPPLPQLPLLPLLPGNPTSWSTARSFESIDIRHKAIPQQTTDSRDTIYSETKGATSSGVHDLDRRMANGAASTEIVQQVDAIVAEMGDKAKLPPTYKRKNWRKG